MGKEAQNFSFKKKVTYSKNINIVKNVIKLLKNKKLNKKKVIIK